MILCLCGGAAGQEFEVASIKPSAGSAGRGSFCRGGPGSSDPGQITCSHMSPQTLVMFAYELSYTRVTYAERASGEPPQFEIAAKVPAGATKEQIKFMWQKLLKDRFKLAVHRETREVAVYELIVAKGGLKVKEWVDQPANSDAAPWEPGHPFKRDPQGFPILPPGQTVGFYTGDKAWFVAPAGTVQDVAYMLEGEMSRVGQPRPVIDATGLKGKYDLKLSWSPQADTGSSAEGPAMLSALESQLGLKLQPKKSAPVEMLVIDHLEKTPTEN